MKYSQYFTPLMITMNKFFSLSPKPKFYLTSNDIDMLNEYTLKMESDWNIFVEKCQTVVIIALVPNFIEELWEISSIYYYIIWVLITITMYMLHGVFVTHFMDSETNYFKV